MPRVRYFSRRVLLGAFAYLAAAATAPAADYPSRIIRIIVPYPPGAATDTISRAVAAEAGKSLGKTIIIENRPGGGTLIGTRLVKEAPADGYTLLFQSPVLVSNLYALKDPGYSLSDFTAVAMLCNTSYVLLTPSSLPVKGLKDFVAYAKANPGKMNYGSIGPTSRQRALSERLAKVGNFTWAEVPFKGTAESAEAVMGGEVQGYFSTQSFAVTQANSPNLAVAWNRLRGSQRLHSQRSDLQGARFPTAFRTVLVCLVHARRNPSTDRRQTASRFCESDGVHRHTGAVEERRSVTLHRPYRRLPEGARRGFPAACRRDEGPRSYAAIGPPCAGSPSAPASLDDASVRLPSRQPLGPRRL